MTTLPEVTTKFKDRAGADLALNLWSTLSISLRTEGKLHFCLVACMKINEFTQSDFRYILTIVPADINFWIAG